MIDDIKLWIIKIIIYYVFLEKWKYAIQAEMFPFWLGLGKG